MAYLESLTLPQLHGELVLAASRLASVSLGPYLADNHCCRECWARHGTLIGMQHRPGCRVGEVAVLLLALARAEAAQGSPIPHERSTEDASLGAPADAVAAEQQPLLPERSSRAAAFGEPWSTDPEGNVVNEDGHIVVDPYGSTVAEDDEDSLMGRIVACVNFCQGISTADLQRWRDTRTAGVTV